MYMIYTYKFEFKYLYIFIYTGHSDEKATPLSRKIFRHDIFHRFIKIKSLFFLSTEVHFSQC